MSVSLVERASARLESVFSRRSFINRAAMVGSAIALGKGLELILEPGTAYAKVCGCSGRDCACGSRCCNGYTAFCCTVNGGSNFCPANTVIGGWWKADTSSYCGGGPRYYLDCNATCSCGSGSFCSADCDNTDCGCGNGDCDNWRTGCVQFRYGQCNQHIETVGRIVCRMVTCRPPWEIDPTCTTTSARDNATAEHNAPCWSDVRCRTPATRCQVIGVSATAQGQGYAIATGFGRIFTYGDAAHHGDLNGKTLVSPIVAMALTPGGGYYLASAGGGIFTFGDAAFLGSVRAPNKPIVAMALTPSGKGYWLAAADGGVFTFGDAGFFGSIAGLSTSPIIGMAATPSGNGYWLAAADGGVFTYGDAAFRGSLGDQPGPPIVGIAATAGGYWLVSADGSVHPFGTAEFSGAAAGADGHGDVVGMAADPDGSGYWLVTNEGKILAFGATEHGSPLLDVT